MASAIKSKAAVLTLLSNAQGVGPGHSCLVVGDTVWTFEEIQLMTGQSWLILDTKVYLEKNTHRPVVVQELNEKVSPSRVLRYVSKSIGKSDRYGTSGVCSTQVAFAIDAGTNAQFNPAGVDTPRAVYTSMKNLGLVKNSYYYWPGAMSLGDFVRHFLVTQLENEYADVDLAFPKTGIASW